MKFDASMTGKAMPGENGDERLAEKQTIEDFGNQWLRYRDVGEYYGSEELFSDIIEPLLSVAEVRGRYVAEIGSGQGRIVGMLARAGARRILALEPSQSITVLKENTESFRDIITYLNEPGDRLPRDDFDLVVSIGVIHHVPNPRPVVDAVYEALRPGGRFFMWVYGVEGNGLYLALVHPFRRLSRRLPTPLVAALSHPLSWSLTLYMSFCRVLPLPLRGYIRGVLAKLSPRHRRLVIFDQLNPAWAKYYRREEAAKLLEDSGFVDVALHHRHGYSWSVIGTKR